MYVNRARGARGALRLPCNKPEGTAVYVAECFMKYTGTSTRARRVAMYIAQNTCTCTKHKKHKTQNTRDFSCYMCLTTFYSRRHHVIK